MLILKGEYFYLPYNVVSTFATQCSPHLLPHNIVTTPFATHLVPNFATQSSPHFCHTIPYLYAAAPPPPLCSPAPVYCKLLRSILHSFVTSKFVKIPPSARYREPSIYFKANKFDPSPFQPSVVRDGLKARIDANVQEDGCKGCLGL